MRIRVLKRQNSSYLELPKEIASEDELELFTLKPGYYLLSVPIGQSRTTPEPRRDERLSDAERAVLSKLLLIRFDQRVPEQVAKTLDDNEKSVLRELVRRGLVNVFRGAKYKEGVYNITDSIYPLLSRRGPFQAPAQAEPQQAAPADLTGELKRQGFILINDRNQARALSEALSQEMRSGAVTGVKGFDGKFYVVTRSFLSGAQTAIAAVLKEDMDAASVAAAAKLDPDGCMAVLRIMSEAGEILEKKKGVFAPV